jgi:hypothetical protein
MPIMLSPVALELFASLLPNSISTDSKLIPLFPGDILAQLCAVFVSISPNSPVRQCFITHASQLMIESDQDSQRKLISLLKDDFARAMRLAALQPIAKKAFTSSLISIFSGLYTMPMNSIRSIENELGTIHKFWFHELRQENDIKGMIDNARQVTQQLLVQRSTQMVKVSRITAEMFDHADYDQHMRHTSRLFSDLMYMVDDVNQSRLEMGSNRRIPNVLDDD